MNRHELKVIVGQRRTGRTEKLIQWLLKGHALEEYPGWSRVILCPFARDAAELIRRMKLTGKLLWIRTEGKSSFAVPLDVVWTSSTDLRGRRLDCIEYAVDDFDHFDTYPWIMSMKRPAIIVVEGEVYEDDPA